jgi:hypothetical protein
MGRSRCPVSATDDVERIEALDDPGERARAATEAIAEYREAADHLSQIRRIAISEMRAGGLSYAQVGAKMGVTRGRAAQLAGDYGNERRFFGRRALTIAIPLRAARLPDERLVIAQEDQETATVLTQLVQRMDFNVTRSHVSPTGEIDFSPEVLVLVCGPKSSPVVDKLLRDADPVFAFAEDQSGRWRFVDKATGEEFVSPMDCDPAQPSDYAYLGRLPGPEGRPVLLIAGVHAVGSLGVAHYLSHATNLVQLYEHVERRPFSMIIGSTFEGSPRRIIASGAVTDPHLH